MLGAIRQIEVDQRLIWDAGLFGKRLEIGHGICVEVDGDLLLQLLRIGILPGMELGNVIFASQFVAHKSNLPMVLSIIIS